MKLSSKTIPPDILTLIGRIAVQSVYLDLLLGEIRGGLDGIEGPERAIKIHAADARRKARESEQILRSSGTQEDLELALLINQAGELLADRNLVLHGVPSYSMDDEDFSTPNFLVFRGKYKGTFRPISKDTLDPILKEIEYLSHALLKIAVSRGYTSYTPLQRK